MDSGLDALIVRNIGDLEAAKARIDHMDGQLWLTLVSIAKNCASEAAWSGDFDTSHVEHLDPWLAASDWYTEGDNPLAWLHFDEVGGEDSKDVSWIAKTAASGPTGTGFGLYFSQDTFGPGAYKRLMKNNKNLVEAIMNKGFEFFPADGALVVRISIDQDRLADGFQAEDLNDALKPASDAIVKAIDAKPQLDALVALIRTEATAP